MNVPFHIFFESFFEKVFPQFFFHGIAVNLKDIWHHHHFVESWSLAYRGKHTFFQCTEFLIKQATEKRKWLHRKKIKRHWLDYKQGRSIRIKVKISTTKGDSPWSNTRYVTTEIVEVPNNDKLKFMEAPNNDNLKDALGVSKLHMLSSTHQHEVSEIWAKEKRQQENIKVSCIQPKHMSAQ